LINYKLSYYYIKLKPQTCIYCWHNCCALLIILLTGSEKGVGASVTVHLDFRFEGDALLNQEFEDVATVVTLQLNDGSPLVVFNSRSIAAPCFLEGTDHFLQVKVIWETLHQRQALSGGTLLEMQMDKVVRFLLLWCVVLSEVVLVVAAHLISTTNKQDFIAVILSLRLDC